MNPLQSLQDKHFAWITGLACFAILAGAHAFENFAGLAPCALCLEQRSIHWATILACVIAMGLWKVPATRETNWPLAAVAAIVIILAYGAYLAGYHTGVEQKWWPGPATCTTSGAALSVEQMLAQEDPTIVMCDEIQWTLFGITLAGYNFLMSLALLCFNAIPLARAFLGRKK
jgi:disulfide bond formation protein DsbB